MPSMASARCWISGSTQPRRRIGSSPARRSTRRSQALADLFAARRRPASSRPGNPAPRAASPVHPAWTRRRATCFAARPRAFATDDKALAVAEQALAEGFDRQLPVEQQAVPLSAVDAQRAPGRSGARAGAVREPRAAPQPPLRRGARRASSAASAVFRTATRPSVAPTPRPRRAIWRGRGATSAKRRRTERRRRRALTPGSVTAAPPSAGPRSPTFGRLVRRARAS